MKSVLVLILLIVGSSLIYFIETNGEANTLLGVFLGAICVSFAGLLVWNFKSRNR